MSLELFREELVGLVESIQTIRDKIPGTHR